MGTYGQTERRSRRESAPFPALSFGIFFRGAAIISRPHGRINFVGNRIGIRNGASGATIGFSTRWFNRGSDSGSLRKFLGLRSVGPVRVDGNSCWRSDGAYGLSSVG